MILQVLRLDFSKVQDFGNFELSHMRITQLATDKISIFQFL